jgi:hypothetical protein
MANVIRRSVREAQVARSDREVERRVERALEEEKALLQEKKDTLFPIVDNSSPGRKAQVWQQYQAWGPDKSLIVRKDTRRI